VPLLVWETSESEGLQHTFVPLLVESKLSTRLDPD